MLGDDCSNRFALRLLRSHVALRAAVIVALVCALGACESLEGKLALGVGALTAYGAQAPAHEVQQTYYLGVFDPQSQVEPTVYRVRLHGQASAINTVNFASGWLPSIAVDSLGTSIKWDETNGRVQIVPKGQNAGSETDGFQTGRRLVVFGPEGFRESPADQRLVVYMGSSPEQYFSAVNEAFGIVADAKQTPESKTAKSALSQEMLDILQQISAERRSLDQLNLEQTVALPKVE